MRTPKLTAKRFLGLASAASLAVVGTVAFAGPSEAANTYTLSSKTGPGASAGQILVVTGKGFKSAAGTSLVGVTEFQAATTTSCNAASQGANTVTVKSVQTATKMSITVPSLALGASNAAKDYFLCVYASSGGALMGSAKYTVYAVPTIANSGLATTKGSTLGGTEVGITGTNFTSKAKVTFDGVEATKVTFGDATSLTAIAPAHVAEDDVQVRVITEGGSSVNNGAHDDFDYLNAVEVSPIASDGADNSVISLTGKGFNNFTWDTASALSASKTSVVLVPAATTIADTTDLSGGLPTGAYACDTVQVESDTALSCQLAGAAVDGAYTVTLLTLNASQEVVGADSSGYSRAATYAVADF